MMWSIAKNYLQFFQIIEDEDFKQTPTKDAYKILCNLCNQIEKENKISGTSILCKTTLASASSAAVKRMFSFSGHILTNKRRKTSPYLFSNSVFLKLNEEFLYVKK
jgi:hypothetical protein